MKPPDVRALVTAALPSVGINSENSRGERLLLRAGSFIGFRFEFESGSAVWLVDATEIKLFSNAGKLLKTIPLNCGDEVVNKAA